ncbi:probable RNA-directed DNA polymerase from transposon BS [Trichonephila clavipes]|nr:probable RNA-directed DNA polymerase from transposon BS [Trichonephila clavipes]
MDVYQLSPLKSRSSVKLSPLKGYDLKVSYTRNYQFSKKGLERAMKKEDYGTFKRSTIEWTFQVKYLGLILNDNLTYKPHFEETTKKFWRKFYSLIDTLGRKSKLSLKNRLFVYKQYIRPILLYGSAIWGSAGNVHIENLQRLQNRTLRIIARAPRFLPRYILHEELRVEPIHTIIAELASNFHSSIPYHSNETINSQNHFRNLPPSTHRMPHNASSLIPSF